MTRVITSLQNKRVKNAARLRNRRGRKAQDRIIIDGAREVLRALEAGVEAVEIFLCEELIRRPEAQRAVEMGRQLGIPMLQTAPAVFEKLAFGDRAEGVVAVAATPRSALPALVLPENPLVVILERVEKPGNLGGVVRTADAVGAAAVVVADAAADLYCPNAVRASLGTIFSLPVVAAGGRDVLAWLRRQEMGVFAARVEGSVNYTDVDYTGPSAIVLGSEASGLSPWWQADDITSISLPLLGSADSLNVSATAAVLMYEALRQRREAR
jgi:TrmH family RNA methyltransferase